LVVNSPLFREVSTLYDEDSLPPIGLGYIATALERASVAVRLIDAVADRIPLAQLVQGVLQMQPRTVAVNVFTTNYEIVRDFVQALSGRVPHVVVGALSARTLHTQIFKWDFEGQLDVVLGDGELIIVPLVTDQVAEAPAATALRRRFFRVDSKSMYYVTDISDVPLNRAFFSNEPVHHPLGFLEANIVASRGCIYNCAFCGAARSRNADMGIRERSPDSLRRELRDMARLYPSVTSIRVLDDLFLKKPAHIARAANLFSEFPFQWRSMAHVLTFQGVGPAELARLKSSGCAELFVGIESGSERILRQIRKTHDIGRIFANLERVLQAGINIKGYFIFGFPGETEADMEQTYQLALAIKQASLRHGAGFRTSVFQFRPYHGTELHEQLVSDGMPAEAVLRIEPDAKLSDLVGRVQFNFHSGAHAAAASETVRAYIYKTANLTHRTQWGFRAENDVAAMPHVRPVQEPAAAGATPSRPA
jgi:hypothetical protein